MIERPRCHIRECANFIGTSEDENELSQVPFCTAFLKGIPKEIAYGDNLHLKPFPGDHKIQYVKLVQGQSFAVDPREKEK